MRKLAAVLVVVGALSCKSQVPTETIITGLAPPTLGVSATARVGAGSEPELVVSALLRNGTTTPIRVLVGSACPLFVRIFSDPTEAFQDSTDLSMGCSPNGPMLALAPGDTAVLTRAIGAAELSSYLPGTYGINVVVTTSTYLIGVWAGAIALPLASTR